LKGDEIILEARIAAVADVIESMAFHRPYRPAWASMRHWRKSSGAGAPLMTRRLLLPACACSVTRAM